MLKITKVAKNLPKSCPTAMDVLYLIMLHIDENVDKKFQPSIVYRSWENKDMRKYVKKNKKKIKTCQIAVRLP